MPKDTAPTETEDDKPPYYRVKPFTHENKRQVWQLLERGLCVHEYDTPEQAHAAAKRHNNVSR